MPEVLAESIDRLCSTEFRPGVGNLPRGFTRRLYDAARERQDRPLSLVMAERLLERLQPGSRAVILTGAGGPPILPYGELDGPLGAAALAHALRFGRGIEPVIVAEQHAERPVGAACRAAGLNFRRADDPPQADDVTFVALPLDAQACAGQAPTLLDTIDPGAVIAVEKPSPNRRGVIHGSTGHAYDDIHGKPEHLFAEARRRGILTCAIGDGGNEVGFGLIEDAVRRIMPHGDVCQCECRGGSASSVSVDVLMVGAVSNWGAYGVAAMLAFLLGRSDLLIRPDDLERMLRDAIAAGALDGALSRPSLTDDGIPLAAHRALLTLLATQLALAGASVDAPGH